MKIKLLFMIVFALFVQIGNAQVFGIKGGINFANMTFSGNGMVSPKSIVGFHLGPVAEFKLQERLYFNTGLLYSIKGAKSDNVEVSGSEKTHYLEIPLNLAYKFTINETSDFFIQAGPFLAYGLSNTDNTGGESADLFKDGLLKRLDFGLGFGAGVEFGSFVTSLNYELGLADLNDDPTYDGKIMNKVLQISIAYMFGEK